MDNKRCDRCIHWQRISPDDVFDNDGTNFSDSVDNLVEEGECKRYPPAIVNDMLQLARMFPLYKDRFPLQTPKAMLHCATAWPITFCCDSCGEWKSNADS